MSIIFANGRRSSSKISPRASTGASLSAGTRVPAAPAPSARACILYVCGAQTSSRAIFVCTVRTIHQWNPEATRFPTMCNTCAAAQSKTVRTGLTFCHSVRHVYSCTLCTTVPGHTVVYPVCGEYQARATCRFQTEVPRTEKMSAKLADSLEERLHVMRPRNSRPAFTVVLS